MLVPPSLVTAVFPEKRKQISAILSVLLFPGCVTVKAKRLPTTGTVLVTSVRSSMNFGSVWLLLVTVLSSIWSFGKFVGLLSDIYIGEKQRQNLV